MDVHFGQELLDELGSSLENLETQQSALLQFLKEKGIVTDEQLAPYLTQAGNASNVRWRAARLRLERLLSGAQQDQAARPQTLPVESDKAKSSKSVSTKTDGEKKTEEEQKTEEKKAGPREKNSESVESSEAKSREEAKPSPRDPEEDAA